LCEEEFGRSGRFRINSVDIFIQEEKKYFNFLDLVWFAIIQITKNLRSTVYATFFSKLCKYGLSNSLRINII
ncbi:hypothetical protein L9F63_011236, partial [Diploptera punctata]